MVFNVTEMRNMVFWWRRYVTFCNFCHCKVTFSRDYSIIFCAQRQRFSAHNHTQSGLCGDVSLVFRRRSTAHLRAPADCTNPLQQRCVKHIGFWIIAAEIHMQCMASIACEVNVVRSIMHILSRLKYQSLMFSCNKPSSGHSNKAVRFERLILRLKMVGINFLFDLRKNTVNIQYILC